MEDALKGRRRWQRKKKERRIYGISNNRKEPKVRKQAWKDGTTGRRKKAKVAGKGSLNARAERRTSEMPEVSEGQHQWYTAKIKKNENKIKTQRGAGRDLKGKGRGGEGRRFAPPTVLQLGHPL